MIRVISAQKLPTPVASRRAKPRNSAKASAMPVAARGKLWIVSAEHLADRFESAASPEYHCQLVLVVKLTPSSTRRPASARQARAG